MMKPISDEVQSSHISRVFSSVSVNKEPGGSAIQTPLISRSWQRCINQYKISPEQHFSAKVLEENELREYQDAFSDTHELARNSLDKLYGLIADIGYTVLLTDKDGITLDCCYDPERESELKKRGLYTGTDWSEKVAGTNGIGTCLVEETPVVIKKEEHFFPVMVGMTCTVSPIFDSTGKLIAALDATTLNPETISQNKLISKLVEQYARQIETFYFINEFKNHWLLRFSNFKDTSDNVATGILAINEDGVITAGNRNALKLLCTGSNYKINNRIFHDVFDLSFSELLDDFSKKLSSGNSIRAIGSDAVFFFSLMPPAVRPLTPTRQCVSPGNRKPEAKSHPDLDNLTGTDVHMQITAKKIRQIINLDLPILISGETGTGKEAMVRAIHNESLRKEKPFVAINCASIPDSLIESELFGYSSGTFTGALKKGMKGKILQANEGTLFLDEIGDMPVHLQTRLLRVLSEMEVVPLGGIAPIPLNIQLISATNKKISELIEKNLFRSDLFFRLNGVSVELPPLRNRTDKQDLIINIFNTYSSSKMIEISASAMQILINYSWPGNVRQLINVAKYSNAMCLKEIITEEHIPEEIKSHKYEDMKHNTHFSEYDFLLNSLKDNKWNITKVSKHLNICRATVYRKMEKYNISSPNES